MRYYLIKSTVTPEVWDTVIDEYDTLSTLGKDMISVEGGKLISQFVGATEPVTYSIMQFSGSPARLLYRLLSVGIHSEVQLTELISKNDFEKVVDHLATPVFNK